MLLSCLSGLLSEGLCWLLIYRTSSYKRLESELEKANKRLELAKATPSAKSKKQKKGQRVEELVNASKGEIFKIQMKTAMVVRSELAGNCIYHSLVCTGAELVEKLAVICHCWTGSNRWHKWYSSRF